MKNLEKLSDFVAGSKEIHKQILWIYLPAE